MLGFMAWRNVVIVLTILAWSTTASIAQQDPVAEARRLHAQVLRLHEAGKYQQAVSLAKRALAIREAALPGTHPELVASLRALGRAQVALGADLEAEAVLKRAIAIQESAARAATHETALLLIDLGGLYRFRYALADAEPLYVRALAICERILGEEHTDTAKALNGLASLYTDGARFQLAEPLYQRALAIRERVLGEEHPETAKIMMNLGTLYIEQGTYSRALPLLKRGLAVREKALGPEHPDLLLSLHGLANAQFRVGAFLDAEVLLQRALAIAEEHFGPQHAETAFSLTMLGSLFMETRAYARAEPFMRRAIALQEAQQPPRPVELANSLNLLALLLEDSQRDGEAQQAYARALQLTQRALGQEHGQTATAMGNLGRHYGRVGSFERAEALLRRSLAIRDKVLGAEHPETLLAVRELADLYADANANARADPLYRRLAAALAKTPGLEHRFMVDMLRRLATLHWQRGRPQQALPLLQRAQRIQAKVSERELLGGSESRKQTYMQAVAKTAHADVSFSLTAPSQAAAELGLTSVLQYKGRVLDAMSDSMARLRRGMQPADRELLDQLALVTEQLSMLAYGTGVATPGQAAQRLAELTSTQERLEAGLARRSSEFRRQLTPLSVQSVRRAIPANAMLIEWFRHQPFDPKQPDGATAGARYVAYLLGRSGAPVVIDVGAAETVDALVKDFRAALSNPARTDVKQHGAALSQRIFAPLRSHLGTAEHLLMSPDGALNLVPMAALLDERGTYLLESFEISYLTSGRDLLRSSQDFKSSSPALVIADPAYGRIGGAFASNNPAARLQRSADLDRGGLRFRRLVGTAREARDLQALLRLKDSQVRVGDAAQETTLKRVRAPLILHVASHGFFLSDRQQGQASTAGVGSVAAGLRQENPLLRSGIALAGANQRRSGNDDGILTALEAAQLDLYGTELVVLSACDSGVGQVQNGEGVHGLRRALALAGTQTQVTSLWRVSDAATRILVVSYYERLLAGAGRSAALRQAQRAMLAKSDLAHPYYWAALVPIGNWGRMPGLRSIR